MTNLHSVGNFWTKGLLGFVVALALIAPPGCGSRHAKAPMPAATKAALYDVDVYRGVDANASGRAALSPSQFGFNPGLSVFMSPAQAPVQKPCNYRFQITGVAHEPPEVNDTGVVAGLPGGYTADFNNDPVGHWDIIRPAGVTPDEAKTAVSDYAKEHRDHVVNGTQNNCN